MFENVVPCFQGFQELIAQGEKLVDVLFEALKFGCSQVANFVAGSTARITNLKNPCELIEGETDGKRGAN